MVLLQEEGVGAGAALSQQGQRFGAEQRRVLGQVGQRGGGFDRARGGHGAARVAPGEAGRSPGWQSREASREVARGPVAKRIEDADGAREMVVRGAAVIDGEAAGHARGLGDDVQGGVGVLVEGGGEERRAVERPAAGAEGLGGDELHPDEEVAIGHALDVRQGAFRGREGFVGAVGAEQPADASVEVPEAVVGVAALEAQR